VYVRGIYDNKWESETLDSDDYSDTTDDDKDNYGHFGIFAMPKVWRTTSGKLEPILLKRKNLRSQ